MVLPSNREILKAVKDIEKKRRKKQDHVLRVPAINASIEERFKFSISQKLLEFKLARSYSFEEMAQILGTDRSNVNKILNGKIEKVSLDRLFSYLSIVVMASKNKKMASDFNKAVEHFIEFEELKFG